MAFRRKGRGGFGRRSTGASRRGNFRRSTGRSGGRGSQTVRLVIQSAPAPAFSPGGVVATPQGLAQLTKPRPGRARF